MDRTQIKTVGRNGIGRGATAGFSLVELMVAMVIGLIITFAVVQIFTTSRTTYQTDEGLARVQENGRFAIEFLSREIRQVGDLGCQQANELLKSISTNPAVMYDSASAASTTMTGIQGYEYQNTGPGDTYTISSSNPAEVSVGWLPVKNTITVTSGIPSDLTLTDAVGGGTGLVPNAIPGTDAIVIQRMINIVPAAAPQEDQQYVYAPAGSMPDSGPAVISNCRHASFFMISANDPAAGADRLAHDAGNTCKIWRSNATVGSSGVATALAATSACQSAQQGYSEASNNTDGAAVVGQLLTTAFYIGRGATGSPALFQRTAQWDLAAADYINSLAPQELVDGIENMQILYGVDAGGDGTVDTYVTADAVTSWIEVVSVQISLLARSSNVTGDATDLSDDTDSYVLAGPDAANAVTVDPFDDKRRRRVFSVTVQLRNRGF